MILTSDAKIGAAHLDLDLATGNYQQGDQPHGALTAVPAVRASFGGGVALLPSGRLVPFAAGAPRLVPGVGLLIEAGSTNALRSQTAAPISSTGWTLSSPLSGQSISIVDDRAALYAATDSISGEYLFRDLIDAGIMNGNVLRIRNTQASILYVTSTAGTGTPTGAPSPWSISSYVRCISGSGDIRMFGSGTGPTFENSTWQRTARANITPDQSRQMVLTVNPQSEILFVLMQMERGPNVTSPIPVHGAAASRAVDKLELTGPFLSRAHTIYISAIIDRTDGSERRLLTLADDRGAREATITRAADNALRSVATNGSTNYAPVMPRVYGPGRITAGLRLGARGRAMAFGGAMAEDQFSSALPLARATIGAAGDGSLPLGGWVARILVEAEADDARLLEQSAPAADSVPLDFIRYVDPAGDNANDGRSPAAPWRTIAKLNASALIAGTQVRFKRGGQWQESLVAQSGCTYAAYGEGPAPKIGTPELDDAVSATSLQGGARFQDLHLTTARLRGIDWFGGQNMQLVDCEVSYCGSRSIANSLAISFRGNGTTVFANNVYIRGTYIHHCGGDDIFVQYWGGQGIVEGCRCETPQRADADSIQFSAGRVGSRALVRCNSTDMATLPTNSTKGNVVVEAASAIVEDNHTRGGNFGIGLNSSNAQVRRNLCEGARMYNYSWGIGFGERDNLSNAIVENNLVRDCTRGLAISGSAGSQNTTPVRVDFVLQDNTVEECATGVYIDRPTSGTVVANKFIECGTDVYVDPRTTTVPSGGRWDELGVRWNDAA